VGAVEETIREAAGGTFAVPIRATPTIPVALRKLMHRQLFHGLTGDEQKLLPPQELERFARVPVPVERERRRVAPT
jgi:hypothetical protein